MKKLTHEEILSRQSSKMQLPRLPFVVVLDNIRSLFNVGAVFRTADGAGIEKIWLCGITGYPPQSAISKTALGAEERIPWEHAWDVVKVVAQHKKSGYEIVLLEQIDRSIEYQNYQPEKPVCLVIGNEITGVSAELLPLCDVALEIDMMGLKNSLNVSVAFGIVTYHIRNCLRTH